MELGLGFQTIMTFSSKHQYNILDPVEPESADPTPKLLHVVFINRVFRI